MALNIVPGSSVLPEALRQTLHFVATKKPQRASDLLTLDS